MKDKSFDYKLINSKRKSLKLRLLATVIGIIFLIFITILITLLTI